MHGWGIFQVCEQKVCWGKKVNFASKKSKPSTKPQTAPKTPKTPSHRWTEPVLASTPVPSQKVPYGLEDRANFFQNAQMSLTSVTNFSDFETICQKLNRLFINFPLPTAETTLNELITRKCKVKVDEMATALLPQSSPGGVQPLVTMGDGNCLPRAASYHVFGDECGRPCGDESQDGSCHGSQ